MRIESLGKHPLTRRKLAHLTKWRGSRLPEIAVDIEMGVPEAFGDRGRKGRGTGA